MSKNLIEDLVDAIGEALGVDTGTIQECRFRDACDAARRVLGQGTPLPGNAEAKLQELAQAVRIACHHVNNGLTPVYSVDDPDPGVVRAVGVMKELAKVNKQVAR